MAQIEMLKEKATEIRKSIVSMINKANSGHPGGSLSIADILSVLYFHEMKINPENPKDINRDRENEIVTGIQKFNHVHRVNTSHCMHDFLHFLSRCSCFVCL